MRFHSASWRRHTPELPGTHNYGTTYGGNEDAPHGISAKAQNVFVSSGI